MAKRIKVPCGWTAYKLEQNDLTKLQAAQCLGNVCDSCTDHLMEGYYVPILNHCMCEHCFMDWEKISRYCECDVKYEQQNIKWLESWLVYLGNE